MSASRKPVGRSASLERARELHRQGYLPEAEMLYLEILERSPRNALAMNLLGILRAQSGDPSSGLEWLGKAVAADPQSAAYRFNFGKALLRLGRVPEACEALERSTLLDPGYADAYNELGLARAEAGLLQAAEHAFRKALALQPKLWDAHNNLGLLLHRLGMNEAAEQSLRRALEIEPRSPAALTNLGMVLRAQNRTVEATEAYREALSLNPGDAATLTNLGNALSDLGRHEEAIACFRDAVAAAPDYADAYCNWGAQCLRLRRPKEAVDKFRAALAADPTLPEAQNGLSSALHDSGRLEEAIEADRRALLLRPDDPGAHSHLLFSLMHSTEIAPAQVFAEHRAWAQRHAAAFYPVSVGYANAPQPERRLRIGYVSGDFRHHSVAQFFEPVLARHDRGGFEIFCYYNFSHADETTARLRRSAGHWREIASLGDDAVADLVRADRIDVLVDLSGHTRYNRLLVFARKPAPVQATWLGYLNTTGLDTMDYRVTDARASPEGALDTLHTERLVRLPDCQWCYQPPPDCPPVALPPAVRERRPVTFAVFCTLPKIGPRVIALWSRLLERVPGSRLMVVAPDLDSIRDEFLLRFAARGAAPERIELRGFCPFRDYLALHEAADVIVDTFPHAGATTTCHALWMGVPVVSLSGDSVPGRGGASILGTIGLDELVADSPEQYLNVACDLASDLGRLSDLRLSMRDRMSASPLLDAERFTHNLEQAYRSMWRRWCQDPNRK